MKEGWAKRSAIFNWIADLSDESFSVTLPIVNARSENRCDENGD